MKMNEEYIIKRLKRSRKILGLSKQTLAQRVPIKEKYMNQIESTYKAMMSLEVLVNICRAMDISLDYVLFGKVFDSKYPNIAKYINQLSEEQAFCAEQLIEISGMAISEKRCEEGE